MSKLVVGIGDMKVAADPDAILITYALGSCIGVSLFDPVTRVGGLIHIALPDSAIAKGHDDYNPLKFVDTGIPLLFREAYRLGAQKPRLQVKIAGCSQIADEAGFFNIGKRNYAATRKLLWKNNVMIESEHCGESFSRTMSIDLATGRVWLRIGQQEIPL
jgi:chemotaxis protein CheD